METKTCTLCGVEQPLDDEYFPKRKTKTERGWRWDSWCRTCYAANTRRIQRVDPERKRAANIEYRQRLGPEYYARRKARFAAMSVTGKERAKANARRHNEKLKREAFDHYGGQFCQCCGIAEISMLSLDHIDSMLSLDHIDNNGAAHRKSLTGSTRTMPTASYLWAKRNNWPPIFQVMCFNCNWARHWNNGICPHEIERQKLTALTGNARANHAA